MTRAHANARTHARTHARTRTHTRRQGAATHDSIYPIVSPFCISYLYANLFDLLHRRTPRCPPAGSAGCGILHLFPSSYLVYTISRIPPPAGADPDGPLPVGRRAPAAESRTHAHAHARTRARTHTHARTLVCPRQVRIPMASCLGAFEHQQRLTLHYIIYYIILYDI